ncbi:MAG TPA: DUF4249 family protein [Chryseosolibacter sp.]
MALNFRILKNAFIAALAVELGACEMVTEIQIPNEPATPVLNAAINPDSAWSINLSWARNILDSSSFTYITNAAVTITDEGGSTVATLSYEHDGRYTSDGKPETGKTYTVIADIPNFGKITSTARVPLVPKISNGASRIVTFDNAPQGFFSIWVEDDAAEKNFYEISLMQISEYQDGETQELRRMFFPIYAQSDHPALTNILPYESSFLITDNLFSGKQIELRLKTEAGTYPAGKSRGVAICVRSVTEDYFNYVTTLKLQYKLDQDPLAQPLDVKTNIQGGLGFFGAFTQSAFMIMNPMPVITSIQPTQGRSGDLVVINGENLDSESAATYAYFISTTDGSFSPGGFGLVPTPVIESSPTRLVVVVPKQAKTNRIVIRAHGTYAFSDIFMILD